MNGLLRNLRAGLRRIRRQPAFAAAVNLTLGLGIAANTAIFSFVDALLIHPFPFRDPDQLVQIRSMRGDTMGMLSSSFRWTDPRECYPHRVIRASLYTTCAIRAITR